MLVKLKELGVDVDAGLARFMGNRVLYEKMLKKFPAELDPDPLRLLNEGRTSQATEVVHALKGVTGNLSINILYDAYTDVLAMLRNGQIQDARINLAKIMKNQALIVECINNFHGR